MRIDFSGGKVPLLLGVIFVIAGLYVKVEVAESDGVLLIGLGCLILGIWLVQFTVEWVEELRKNLKISDEESSDDDDPPTTHR